MELGRRELFRFGLEPGDLGRNRQALWECGRREGPVTDERGRERERPPCKKNSAQSTIHYPSPFCHLWSERRAPTKASNSTNWVLNLQPSQLPVDRTEEVGNTRQIIKEDGGV